MAGDDAQLKQKDAGSVSTEPNLTSSEICRVGVRIPPFWPEKPAVWFAQIEGQFVISRITDDSTKFYYVIAQLENQFAAEVEDIIVNPPQTDKYQLLKTELIKRLSVSRQNNIKQLLSHEEIGDRRPSQFLRHLQHLAGPTIPEDFLKTMWIGRLPISMQPILTSQDSLPINALADLADKIYDMPRAPQVAAAQAGTSTASTSSDSRLDAALELMARQMTELTKQVCALSTRVNERSRSRSRGRRSQRSPSRSSNRRSSSNYRRFPVCWYHHKYGSLAKQCITPCDYASGNEQGSR